MTVRIDTKAYAARHTKASRTSGQVLSPRVFLSSPALLLVFVVTQIPLVLMLYYSTLNWNLMRPNAINDVGLLNYIRFLQDSDTPAILLNTLTFALGIVTFSLVIAMALALLLSRQFRGRGLARTLILTPFLIMPTVSALIWKHMLLNSSFGFVTSALAGLGLPRVDLLGSSPMVALQMVIIWEWMPFVMLILLAGLQSVERENVEAAKIDGAGPISLFRFIILPHLARYIEIAVLLQILFVLNIFAEIFVMTSGGPGIATTTLNYRIYQDAFIGFNIGRASAYSVFAVLLANMLVLLFIRILSKPQGREIA